MSGAATPITWLCSPAGTKARAASRAPSATRRANASQPMMSTPTGREVSQSTLPYEGFPRVSHGGAVSRLTIASS
jgi:hypothetical protein